MKSEEYEEQKMVVQYLELIGAKFTSIPNSTYTKSWGQKAKNKASGLRPGLPDLFIIIKDKAFFIEMKKVKGGVLSDYQKCWQSAILRAGIGCYVCKGFDEARTIIDKFR